MSLIGWSLNHLYSTPPEVPLIFGPFNIMFLYQWCPEQTLKENPKNLALHAPCSYSIKIHLCLWHVEKF